MTNQEAFDRVSVHLIAQNERAVDVDGHTCRLRTVDGLKCAVGCLIPDEDYRLALEANPVQVAAKFGVDPALAGALVYVHDDSEPEYWPSELRKVARAFGLNTKALDRISPP